MRITGFENLRNLLIKHEGIRLKPYLDTKKKLTLGVGRNIEEVGVTKDEAMFMLSNDIRRVAEEATQQFAWFKSLNAARQDAVLNMLFNLGLPKFLEFKKMIAALSAQNYPKAADEMLSSDWAGQVGKRAADLADIIRNGLYP